MGVPVDHKRMKPRRQKHRPHMGRVASLPCLVCQRRPVEVHHVRTGLLPKDDRRVVPLCADHHRGRWGFHGLGSERAFYAEHGVDLTAEAKRLEAESVAMGVLPNA